ncbi:hypothetical protein [Limimaricola pyoseonensis]|uniref:Flagellar motor switch protein n=1 Tax=Limimaricola pyoseonensis TaxID=521013 RepID=A0A1G7KCZ8_9RHOB|nr:hypothetical protein [Limimaricola pyoseonensis]SDF34931.1 hypothetical protein SAMN04488567_0169 [Limimaricola pyoseonensis]
MALLIDALILVLLAGVLAYAWVVDRRVRTLMQHLRDLQPLIGEFSAAVDKSEQSVRGLSEAARDLQEPPAPRAPRAPALPGRTAEKAARAARARNQAAGVTRVTGKADLVQSFFDRVKDREE